MRDFAPKETLILVQYRGKEQSPCPHHARFRIGSFPERSSGKEREELCRSAVLWVFNNSRLFGWAMLMDGTAAILPAGLLDAWVNHGGGAAMGSLLQACCACKKALLTTVSLSDRERRRGQEHSSLSWPLFPSWTAMLHSNETFSGHVTANGIHHSS